MTKSAFFFVKSTKRQFTRRLESFRKDVQQLSGLIVDDDICTSSGDGASKTACRRS